ncbi:hypothetical protein AK812_SmicGene3709 [Symbiodinium microadriaticum]|uniref:Uncharacterized protein n=1 Tax=Symbiodinium microadriaticum TaxID=2951 RepID=A0A1Q9EY54_SYMMI|nr:hypothetical protein AK812_SmicGene3709 [Symbiodinium microadriaticum]
MNVKPAIVCLGRVAYAWELTPSVQAALAVDEASQSVLLSHQVFHVILDPTPWCSVLCPLQSAATSQQEQERRLALIASELQTFARSEFQPDQSCGRIGEVPEPAAPALHVSLRDLRASDEGAWRELQKLQGQLAETQQDLKDLNSCYQKRMEEQEEHVETLSSRLQNLMEDQEAARASLQDHETRLGVNEADQAEVQEAAKASCQRNSSSFDEVHKVHSRLSSELAEVRAAFETLEQEIMESCSNHKQSVQTRQQQVLEQVEELRFLSQQRHTEAQEQFKTFQQLVLSQQWEAKQIADGELRSFQIQLDKALWQKNGADWAKAAEDGASPSAIGAEPKTSRVLEPPPSPLREDFPAQWRSILEDVIRRSKCLCEQTKVETDTKLGDLEAKLRKCMKGLLDEQLKINQRTSQEASEAQETGQLSAELVKAAEAKFKRGLEWSLLSVRSEFQRDLENLRETQQKVLGQVQQTLASVSNDMEIAATSSARLGKSVKKVEDKVQDMSVSVAQHQADIDELRAEASTLARTNKRVDDLWRQVEGVRVSMASPAQICHLRHLHSRRAVKEESARDRDCLRAAEANIEKGLEKRLVSSYEQVLECTGLVAQLR